jgi:Ring finger domain
VFHLKRSQGKELCRRKTHKQQNTYNNIRMQSDIDDLVRHPLIPFHQHTRLKKAFVEQFFLLESNKNGDTLEFKMTGSTMNVYSVTIDKRGIALCTCPDQRFCNREKCFCKHTCFVLGKIGKLQDHSMYSVRKPLSEEEIEAVWNNKNDAVVNVALLEKLLLLSTEEDKFEKKSEKIIEDTDECPVCYCILKNGTKLVTCPDCKNSIHKACMDRWLNFNQTCVYCRSEIWEQAQRSGNGKYVNLGV